MCTVLLLFIMIYTLEFEETRQTPKVQVLYVWLDLSLFHVQIVPQLSVLRAFEHVSSPVVKFHVLYAVVQVSEA